MLVLDNSLGTEQSTDRIQTKSFGEDDRIGLIAATAPARSLLALTGDRKKVANDLQRAGTRIGGSAGSVSVVQNPRLDLVGAISQACDQFGDAGGEGNDTPRAIVVLFASCDPALLDAAPRLRARINAPRGTGRVVRQTDLQRGVGDQRSSQGNVLAAEQQLTQGHRQPFDQFGLVPLRSRIHFPTVHSMRTIHRIQLASVAFAAQLRAHIH
jgi:hypothetical protein